MKHGRRSFLTAGTLTVAAGVAGCLGSLGRSANHEYGGVASVSESLIARTIAEERAPFNAAVFDGPPPEGTIDWELLSERIPEATDEYRDVGDDAVITVFQTAFELTEPGRPLVAVEFEPDVTRFVVDLETWPDRTDTGDDPRYHVRIRRYSWQDSVALATETAIEVPGFGSFDHVE